MKIDRLNLNIPVKEIAILLYIFMTIDMIYKIRQGMAYLLYVYEDIPPRFGGQIILGVTFFLITLSLFVLGMTIVLWDELYYILEAFSSRLSSYVREETTNRPD
jgi:hypothetical protein